MSEPLNLGSPIMSGHCLNPQTENPSASHIRCQDNGGGVLTASTGEWHPCPCTCHVVSLDPEPEYECSGCGEDIYEAPTLGIDEDGDPQYTHISDDGLRMTGAYCS